MTLVPLGTCMPMGTVGVPSISHSDSPARAVASGESRGEPGRSSWLLILGRNFILL